MLNNIKSNFILEKIFNNIKNKKKLKVIKYNKKLSIRLNIISKDFESYRLLKQFNKQFNLKIEDIDTKELDLSDKKIRNEGLELLNKIEFKNFFRFSSLSEFKNSSKSGQSHLNSQLIGILLL